MPLHARALLLSAVLLVLTGAPLAYGQQADTTQLPEIAPREIEIRGEREIDLPSLERQPLVGFASPPRVPTVPPDHQPYVGTYQQTLDDLPESLPVPETVTTSMRPPAEPARGFLEGGSGRYFSRFFEGRVGVPLSETSHLSVHGLYEGSEADPDDDAVEAEVRFESTQEVLRVNAGLHGALQQYALFGTTAASDREGYVGGGSFRLGTTGSVPAHMKLRYDHAQYTSHFSSSSDSIFSQQQVALSGAGTIPLPLRPRLDATVRRTWIGGDVPDETAYSLDAGGHLTAYETEAATVRLGGRVLAYETPADPERSIGTASDTFIAPLLDVEWRLAEGLRLHLRNQPRLGDTALDQLYTNNPYADHAPALQPTLETTNAEVGATVSHGRVRLVATAGYRYAPVYRYFSLAGPSASRSGLYQVRYNAARVLHGGTQIALQGVDGMQASLGVSVRDGALRPQDRAIPNFAPVTADAMFAFSFAGGDGFLKALAHFQSPRYASTRRTTRVDSYFTFDLEGSYALGADIELVAQARHLSVDTHTRWANYPRPPAQVSAGLRLRW